MKLSSSHRLTFQNKDGNKIELKNKVVTQLLSYRQNRSSKPEAGGILLGRYILNCNDVVIDKVTTPMQGDKRSRYHFFRDKKLHQLAIDQVWKLSGGTCNYLGEWHTHPEAFPKPSIIDQREWRKKLLFDQFDSEVLYFVIVGVTELRIWQGYRKSLVIEQMTPLSQPP